MNLTARKRLAGILIATTLVLFSVVEAAAQAAGAATPSQAVQALVGSLAAPGASGAQAGCNALTGQLADCPLTSRLRSRLASPVVGVETGNLVSRSQNPPRSLDVAEVKLPADATVAQVNTRWAYGTDQQSLDYVITFVVRKEAGGWLVDDSYCMDNPASSIYNQPTGPCPASGVTGGGTPGMPSTGAGNHADGYPFAALLALGTVGLGLMLVRRGKRQAS